METTSAVKNMNTMRAQVAGSKGTEWMVSTYNAWQQRSPLESMPKKNPSSLLHLVSRFDKKEIQFNRVLALSFKSLLFILGVILLVKYR